MVAVEIPFKAMINIRSSPISGLVGGMPDGHREFLLDFERGEPDGTQLQLSNVSALPAVRWQQFNLEKLEPDRQRQLVALLEDSLGRRA